MNIGAFQFLITQRSSPMAHRRRLASARHRVGERFLQLFRSIMSCRGEGIRRHARRSMRIPTKSPPRTDMMSPPDSDMMSPPEAGAALALKQ
jgi:hypothetical protein